MTITLEQLYEMQKKLDARIIREKGLEGKDLLPNTVLALQVELAECANEWRGFKHWSNKQTPKMFPLEKCDYCGEEVDYTRPTPFMVDAGADMCERCWKATKAEYAAANDEHIPEFKDYPHFPKKQPQKLLEEYVDCYHFFLSIARQLGVPADDLNILWEEPTDETTIIFRDLLTAVGLIDYDDVDAFYDAWKQFNALGTRLGFTFEQIAAAYVEKNNTNHERQANGY